MSEIFYFYPDSIAIYRRVLEKLSPILDREGLSFHIARPGEVPSPEDPVIRLSLEGGCKK